MLLFQLPRIAPLLLDWMRGQRLRRRAPMNSPSILCFAEYKSQAFGKAPRRGAIAEMRLLLFGRETGQIA
jgi:hypothetical protein